MKSLLLVLALLPATLVYATGPDYPAPQPGYKKVVVPGTEAAGMFTLHLSQKVSGPCFNSTTRMSAEMEAKNLEGWGYTYYVLSQPTGPSTPGRAACRPGKDVSTSVNVTYLEQYGRGSSNEKYFRNYSIDTVIYVPEQVDVKLVRWNAERPIQL